MKKLKYYLFYLMAVHFAPYHFTPRKCYVINKDSCELWNCKYYGKTDCICNSKDM